MIGINNTTGELLEGDNYLHQCIRVLITTRLKSRRMLPALGTNINDYIDSGITADSEPTLKVDIIKQIEQYIIGFIVTNLKINVDFLDNMPTFTLDLVGEYDANEYKTTVTI